MPAIRGAMLTGYLDGSVPVPEETLTVTNMEKKTTETMTNPAYVQWISQDQQVLGYLLNSLSKEILTQVATKTTAAGVWRAIQDMFSSQSRARVTNLRVALATTKKGNMSTAAYFAKMKALGDEFATTGRVLDEEEMVSYILTGLDMDYNPLVSSIVARTDPISVSDLYAQVLNYDTRMELLQGSNAQFQSSANIASRG